MKSVRPLILALLFGAIISANLSAQNIIGELDLKDSTQTHQIYTKSGDKFIGRISKIENTTVYMSFREDKVLKFEMSEIKTIVVKNADGKTALNYRKKDQGPIEMQGTEFLFFSPTAFTYGKKKDGTNAGEYRNIMVLYNEANFAVHEQVDIGFGLMPLIVTNFIQLKGKVKFPVNDFVNLGVGANIYTILGNSNNGNSNSPVTGATHPYGVVTIGNAEKFINLGGGYAFPFRSEDEFGQTNESSPVLTIGGSLRVGERWRIATDMIFLNPDIETPSFYSFGASWFDHKNRVDFGLIGFPTNDSFINVLVLPFATYARRF